MSGKTTVMKPGAAIAACFGKFARCYGRSCRAEFIWFLLFFLVLGALAVWFTSPMIVGMLWALLMIPLSSVGIRRLHDLNLPGGIWTVWLTITVILPMFGLSNYMNNEGHLSICTMPGYSSPVRCCSSSASPAVRKAPTSTARRRA